MSAHIIVPVKPELSRDYDEGELVSIIENGKSFRMRLIAGAIKGDTIIRVVPLDQVQQ